MVPRFIWGFLGVVGLAGCGGGGTSTANVGPLLFAPDSTVSGPFHSILPSGPVAATFDRETGRISINGMDGTLKDDQSGIDLDDGGLIAFYTEIPTLYSTLFLATPDGVPSYQGIFGATTLPGEMPTANAAYSKIDGAILLINDGEALFELVGDVSLDARFADGEVDIILSNLDGTKTVLATENVTNVATIEITGAVINETAFDGGVLGFLGSAEITATLTSDPTGEVAGQFFGPDATEVGAIVDFDDTPEGGVLVITGGFLAD